MVLFCGIAIATGFFPIFVFAFVFIIAGERPTDPNAIVVWRLCYFQSGESVQSVQSVLSPPDRTRLLIRRYMLYSICNPFIAISSF